jgi:ATP-binding cassette subfamily B protein
VRPPSSRTDSALDELRSSEGQAFLRLLARYAPRQAPVFALGIVTGIVARVFELAPAFLLGVSLDMVFYAEVPFALPLLPTGWTPTTPTGQLFLVAGLIGTAYLAAALIGYVNGWAWNHVAQHVQHDARTDAYRAMQGLEIAFFDERQTGELMSVLNNDVNQLERFLTHGLNMGFRIFVLVGGMAIIMLLLNWQLALVPVLVIPVLGLVSAWFIDRIYPKYQVVRSAVATLNSRLENNLGGIEVVKAYGQEEFEGQRVDEASEGYLDAQWDAITTRIQFFPTLRVITAAGFLATFLVGGWWVVAGPPGPFAGTLTAGVLLTFLLYTRRFMWPMREFGRIVNDHQYAEAASERILGLVDREPSVPEATDAVELEDLRADIGYEDVTFTYPGEPEAVLEDVDVAIEEGETVGLVGPTGSGKTTLAKLLLRFYDPDEGQVRIGDRDLREVTLESLREHISYVRQDPYLFYGTVVDNITYAAPEVPRAEAERAARLAGAHGFIQNLPDGYDTMVGERGVRLSGGQRQRIALARALLADPDVLVLDEATSHVDNETEAIIQERLGDITAERTTLVIAHRLSTVRDADRIVVVEDGRVREVGSHEELLDVDGLYARLWRVQAGRPRDGAEAVDGGTARRTSR